jgi:hypothetical protein
MPKPIEYLTKIDIPLWRYCLLAFPVALIPSVLLSALVFGLLSLAGIDLQGSAGPERSTTVGSIIGTVAVAPALETMIVAGTLSLLIRVVPRPTMAAALSGVAWGLLHSTSGLLRGFGSMWSFFVFSYAFLHPTVAQKVPGARTRSRRSPAHLDQYDRHVDPVGRAVASISPILPLTACYAPASEPTVRSGVLADQGAGRTLSVTTLHDCRRPGTADDQQISICL